MTFKFSRIFLLHVFIIPLLIFLLSSCNKKSTNKKVSNKKIDEVMEKANSLLNNVKIDESIIYIDSAFATLKNLSPINLWEKHNFKANIYINHHVDLTKAWLTVDSMYMALKGVEKENAKEYIYTKFTEGEVLLAGQNYEEGYKKYYEGELFAQNYSQPCERSDFKRIIGTIKYKQGLYLEAVPYLKQSLIDFELCTNEKNFDTQFVLPQSILNTIGLSYEKEGMLDSAVIYYKKGLDFIEKNKSKFPEKLDYSESAIAVFSGNLGGTYALLGENKQAETLLKKSIEINYKPGNAITDAYSAQLKLARLYINDRKIEDGRKILDQIGERIKTWGPNYNSTEQKLLLNYTELHWRLLDQSTDTIAAYKALKQHQAIKESVSQATKSLNSRYLEDVIRLAKNDYELNLLNKDKNLTSIYLWGAILFSVMMIIMMVLIVNYLRKTKKHLLLLKKLNQTIWNKNIQVEDTLLELEKSRDENHKIMKTVYHDLRGPIGGMTMAVTLMLEDEHHNEEDREMLKMIQTSGQDAISLIGDMLNENTEVEIKKLPVDIKTLLEYCSSMLQFKADIKEQTIELICNNFTFQLDEEKIRRVVGNLIGNAIKFSPKGSKIILKCEVIEDKAIISCEDFGMGVPEDQREMIFEMFTQAKKVGTMGEETFGMGLAISRQIVIAHNGMIWCENKETNGSIFKILLPLV